MKTQWTEIKVSGIAEIPGLPGVRVEALPVFKDPRGSLHELFRADEIPAGFKPLMACSSWSHPGVTVALEKERQLKLIEPATWKKFAARVEKIRTELPALVRKLKSQGKRVIGYGASAKGNTLLNTCGLTSKDLDYIIDNTPFKQNKVAPGSWIPVQPPETLLADQPDFGLVLAWNFAKEIIGRETEYQKRGGRFIVPIPEPRIVESGDSEFHQ